MSAARQARALAADAARQVEDGAKLAAFQSRHRATEAGTAVEATRDRNATLLGPTLDPALRAHLMQAGVRHLRHLEAERDRLAALAAQDHRAWAAARLRVRSLDKLVDRLDTALRVQHRQAENAGWQDLVTGRPTGSAIMGQAIMGQARGVSS